MVTIEQGFALEIVAKPACIHPSPKTSFASDIRPTIRGAVPVNLGFFPAPTKSSGVCPRRTAIPSLICLDEHEPRHHPLQFVTSRRNSALKTDPYILPVPKSIARTLQELKCGAKPEQRRSTTVANEVEQLPADPSSATRDKPTLHENFTQLTPRAKLKTVKQFLEAFEYKQTPGTYFNTHKLRPLARIMDITRMIIYAPQPIKCVEAVFLALYLTAGIVGCDRIPLSFKTSHGGQIYQHIVLLVCYGDKFGAFGISRHPGLMTKDIKFSSICEIVEDYKKTYEEAEHLVLKIRVGLLCCEALEGHMMKQTKLWNKWLVAGKGADPRRKCQARKAALDNKLLRRAADLNRNKKEKREESAKIDKLPEKPGLVKTRPVGEGTCSIKIQEPLLPNRRVVLKTTNENMQDSFHGVSKPLMKVHVLKSQASRFLRHNSQFVNPKFFSRRRFLRPDSKSFQSRRKIKVSLDVDTIKQPSTRPQEKERKQSILVHA